MRHVDWCSALPFEEIDHISLKGMMAPYVYVRDKIHRLIKQGSLIRVKKGLYVRGKNCSKGPYSRELLANLIYGPSAISLEYALWFYGMIPDRVETITSITNKRNKNFTTPVGAFSYRYLNQPRYSAGIIHTPIDDRRNIFIASREKALVDFIFLNKSNSNLKTSTDVLNFLKDDMRMDEKVIYSLNIRRMRLLANIYDDERIYSLVRIIELGRKK